MNNIITIESQGGIETVNARELHARLEVGKDFATWIKDRIEKYGFIEAQDYTIESASCSPNLGSKIHGGHNRLEYHLSIDMAKELAMVENNEQGRKIRRWFIEREKQLSLGFQRITNMDKAKWALQVAFEVLQPDQASKLMMTHKAFAWVGAPTSVLPDYVPAGPIARSASELLKANGQIMGARTFNLKAHAAGYLDLMTRPSVNKGTKYYWSITAKGQQYGKNHVSPHNTRETQPLWYEASFMELLAKL